MKKQLEFVKIVTTKYEEIKMKAKKKIKLLKAYLKKFDSDDVFDDTRKILKGEEYCSHDRLLVCKNCIGENLAPKNQAYPK